MNSKNTKGQFENELLPELDIVITPNKLTGKVRFEILNPEFAKFAVKEGIVPDDLVNDISFRQAGEFMKNMVKAAPKFYERCKK